MDTADAAAYTGFPLPTLLTLVWTAITVIWSVFTPPHNTFAARVLLFQPAWFLRSSPWFWGGEDANVIPDLALALAMHSAWSHATAKWHFIALHAVRDYIALDLDDEALQMYGRILALLGSCALIAVVGMLRGRQIDPDAKPGERHLVEQIIDESLLPALLIPSRTTHTRRIPHEHSFAYSYLFVGIPVGFQGRLGSVLSVDEGKKRAWFDVRGADYLERSSPAAAQARLSEKLKRYLHTQGITDRDYAFAYLVTAPRFLRYSFNPVSFWYLYDDDTQLKYMILEVNNTFDERRMYLLQSDGTATYDADGNVTKTSTTLMFTNTWAKDFHVSPFNDRAGSYSLKAVDPLAALEESGQIRIDNTIVLRTTDAKPKIVARVYSTGAPIEPEKVQPGEWARFIFSWWWVGLATLPRIIWEARKLFFNRKLPVWYRPEVTDTSIGRPYSDDEWELEDVFRGFLARAVRTARTPLAVTYEPAHHEGRPLVYASPSYNPSSAVHRARHALTFTVATPAFYLRFLHYRSAREAFEHEILAAHAKSRTARVSSAELLPVLLDAITAAAADAQLQHSRIRGPLDQLRWSALRRLRCPPPASPYPADATDESRGGPEPVTTPTTTTTTSAFQPSTSVSLASFSELDLYVQQYVPPAAGGAAYRRIATAAFLAGRIAGDLPPLVTLLDLILRAALLLAALVYADRADTVDVLRPRPHGSVIPPEEWRAGAVAVGLANAVHVWSWLKG